MDIPRLLISLTVILGASSSSGAVVMVHGAARLTCNEPCSGEVKCVYAKGSEILVTRCKQGSCLHGDAFKDRTELKVSGDGLYLHLNKVEYNDDGMYIFYCDEYELCRTTLDVLGKSWILHCCVT
ncbi:uncharacterized protein DAT39_018709 [Clarias magur]|uniref:Uncharacterized protein n=1 Tax=Clarias magur TaxID=1594786 RepID=A0A8J4TTQ7_CLAMG|nr:uncharacterized protein DAT39_018709 [Clarias magur]